MKKRWEIRPWVFVALVVLVVLGALVVFGSYTGGRSSYNVGYDDYEAGYGEIMMASDAPMEIALEAAPRSAKLAVSDIDERFDLDDQARMVIKTGSVSMVVDDVRDSVQAIIDYAEDKGGFLVDSRVDKRDIETFGEVTVRIPSEHFEQGIEDIKEMGEVESENIHGEDITEEYVDLEARLGNLEATEAQFLEIMERATEIEDVLAVQRELTWVRAEIESIKGRMQYLEENVDMSTLTVFLSTDPGELPVLDKDEWKPWAEFKDALRSLVGLGQGAVNAVIWVIVFIPALIVIYILYRVVRRYWGRHHKRN